MFFVVATARTRLRHEQQRGAGRRRKTWRVCNAQRYKNTADHSVAPQDSTGVIATNSRMALSSVQAGD
jgi:hypothetical protein